MVHKFFDKKTFGSGNRNENIWNKELAEELHKSIIRKFNWQYLGAALADMQLISKFNKRYRFLLYVTEICSKYAWVIFWKIKKTLQLLTIFKNF